ncbi:hypothetical protein [Marilutibacter spongiae]|uniref:Uncharacterized protein n=1 Tax=Marilutibacter spongiae TaxID=2025720 RepID=A0A7W3TK40_9GAMM|nr:hypothetical protein [Lysobacter spongiae]MBB1059840.1 hypothetical protein [Lysobacter spongiae]
MGDKQDMTLGINVTVSGSVDANGNFTASATYSQGASNPASSNVVQSDGSVNLGNMAFSGSDYNRQTDITFTLGGTVTNAAGTSLPFSFPTDPASAITITGRDGNGVDGMTAVAGSSVQSVVLDDEDKRNRSYNYCLTIWARTDSPNPGDGVSCTLDPVIVNRAD